MRISDWSSDVCSSDLLVVERRRLEQGGEQAFTVLLADRLGGRRLDPLGGDFRRAQQGFDALAALIGNDEHGRSLLARAAGAARAMLERFGIAGGFDMDDETEAREIEAARGEERQSTRLNSR